MYVPPKIWCNYYNGDNGKITRLISKKPTGSTPTSFNNTLTQDGIIYNWCGGGNVTSDGEITYGTQLPGSCKFDTKN